MGNAITLILAIVVLVLVNKYFSPRTIGGLKLTLTKKIMKTRIKRWKKLER